MRPLCGVAAILSVGLLCSSMPAAVAKTRTPPRSAAPAKPAPPASAEAFITAAIRDGRAADLNSFCPVAYHPRDIADVSGGIDCHRVKASVLAALITQEQAKERPASQGLHFTGILVDGSLDLRSARIKQSITFDDDLFLGKLVLADSRFDNDLRLANSVFVGGVDAVAFQLAGRLMMTEPVVASGPLNLKLSKIEVGLSITRGKFDSASPLVLEAATIARVDLTSLILKSQVDAAEVQIAGAFVVKDLQSVGPVALHAASFGTHANILGGQLSRGLDLSATTVAGDLTLEKLQIGDEPLGLRDAIVKGGVEIRDTGIEQGIDANGLQISASAMFERLKTRGQIDLSRAHVVGDVTTSQSDIVSMLAQKLRVDGSFYVKSATTIAGNLDLKGASIAADVTFDDVRVGGDLDVKLITVGKLMDLENTSVENKLAMNGAQIAGDLEIGEKPDADRPVRINLTDLSLAHLAGSAFIHKAVFKEPPVLIGIIVESHLDIAGSELPGLDLTRAQIKGDFRVASEKHRQSTVWRENDKSNLSLRYAHIGLIQDDIGTEPGEPWPKKIDLDGMQFDHFGTGRTLGWTVGWLDRNTRSSENSSDEPGDFQRQPYDQIAKHLQDEGHREDSDAILYAAKLRETALYWHRCANADLNACGHAIGLTLLRVMIGYGIGNGLFNAFYWVAGFTLLGTFVLSFGRDLEGRFWCGKGRVWCIGASINQIIPIVELNPEFKEFFNDPERKILRSWQLIYFGGHAIMGYLLASFIAAAIAGLTQTR